MFDYTYFRQIYELLQQYLIPLCDDVRYILSNVEMILQAGIFFGFVFLALNFVSKRWLVLNG